MDVKDIHVLIKIKVNKFLLNSTFVLILFLIDRFSKVYVIELVEKTEISEIYITSFLNSYLVWNTGIAFGLFSFSNEFTYNLFTALIILINLIIIYLATVTKDFRRYFFLLILGGSFGNLFDRLLRCAWNTVYCVAGDLGTHPGVADTCPSSAQPVHNLSQDVSNVLNEQCIHVFSKTRWAATTNTQHSTALLYL